MITDEVLTVVRKSFSGVEVAGSLDDVIGRGRRIRRRRRMLAGGTAVGAAAAVGLSVLPLVGPAGGRTAGTEPYGPQILLAAADRAERVSTAGRYWHVKTDESVSVKKLQPPLRSQSESWITRDGHSWSGRQWITGPHAGESTFFKVRGRTDFRICDDKMTYRQLAALPTEAAALRARLLKAMGSKDDSVPAARRDTFTLYRDAALNKCLSDLLVDIPVSPKVRAAAYRVLAASPDATVTGKTTDPRGRAGVGVTLRVPAPAGRDTIQLVIDPSTSLVLSTLSMRVHDGSAIPSLEGFKAGDVTMATTRVYVQVGWTNERPHPPS